VEEVVPALRPGSANDALEQVPAGAHWLGDPEQVGVGCEPGLGGRVAAHLDVEEVGGVTLPL
jgi:hypothetical protein